MFGLTKPSLTLRIIWGKLLGLIIGAAGFIMIPYFAPGTDFLMQIGILLWYSSIGAIIGIAGVYSWHPILRMKVSWWWRGMLFGAWFNFLLLLFGYEKMEKIFVAYFGNDSVWSSPWWIIVEGAIVGFFLDWILTKIAGDGPKTVESLK